ncbi:MAG: GGDEF domain-containing protein [Chlamydiae bacterium]|nr:GGDEF domain-containing protein [Chlamydiota bacterium]MBI3266903.1 GGDEF domain-containing protein [Chlamydiota bacterium]
MMKRSFKTLLSQFCSLTLSEEEAEQHWYSILSHQKQLEEALSRPVGFTVALADYFMNRVRKIRGPVLIERDQYRRTQDCAIRDSLTGLYNRRFLKDYLEKEFDKSRRYPLAFSLLFLDVDHFKRLNDKWGHLVGDRVLQRIAKILSCYSRGADLVARFGGEEFVVVMSQTLGRVAMEVADRLRVHIKTQEFLIPGSKEIVHVTVSGGIATCPSDALDADELLRQADEALYMAKEEGRNRIIHHRDIPQKTHRCVNM